jgi:enoyl-CoA hydratase
LCTLILNRPDKMNALDTAAFEELDEHLKALEADDTIGCVALQGSGRAFCAGADLVAFGSSTAPPTFKPSVIERLAVLKQPTVAAIHGVCFTGGLELALACDFIVADASARFADTHGKFGLVSAWGMTQRLSRRIGRVAAKRMMMSALTVDSSEAKALGLVDVLAPDGGLENALEEFTKPILSNSWFTNFAVKRVMSATDGMSLAEGLAHEHFRHPGFAPDHQTRVAQFRDRRR